MEDTVDYVFKFIFLGNAAVGKTSILRRIVGKKFEENYTITTSLNLKEKTVMVTDETYKCLMYDLGGQVNLQRANQSMYNGALGIFLVVDLNDPSSINMIDQWVDNIVEKCGKIPVYVIGNKVDLERNISKDEMETITGEMRERWKKIKVKNTMIADKDSIFVRYRECSAKDSPDITFDDLFKSIFKDTYHIYNF